MDIYEPAEDSHLLQKQVRQLVIGRVLDMGTGSGIQAITAARHPGVREVVAVDLNQDALNALQEKIQRERLPKIRVLQSDLFEHVHSQFNVIIFNPPYLPQDPGIEDAAIYGGKKGWELIERFFQTASKHLLPEGKILLLFSSLTQKEKIDLILSHHLFAFQEIDHEKMAFEELYVYQIEKSPLLRQLEGKGIESIQYYTAGKRGLIYRGVLDCNQFVKKFIPLRKKYISVAIKIKKEESKASDTIAREAAWLEKLNRLGIGPKLLFSTAEFVVTDFIEGENLPEWLENHSSEEIRIVLVQTLDQCFVLDRQKITKEEMHHPYKHIIVNRFQKPVLIDFERCHETEKPQNVTQFVEYICRLKPVLEKRNFIVEVEKLRVAAKDYKEKYDRESFTQITRIIAG